MAQLTSIQWTEIEKRYCGTDDSISQLAKAYGISRTAIQKKARKLGWRRPAGPYTDIVQMTDTARRIADPQTLSDQRMVAFGKRTPENMERILEMVRDGTPPRVAAQAVGLHPTTLSEPAQQVGRKARADHPGAFPGDAGALRDGLCRWCGRHHRDHQRAGATACRART